jgi:hypothetical protein
LGVPAFGPLKSMELPAPRAYRALLTIAIDILTDERGFVASFCLKASQPPPSKGLFALIPWL